MKKKRTPRPSYPPNYPGPGADRTVTRTELARTFRLHQDSIGRLIASGLSAAVTTWGGNGREHRFSLWMATRFYLGWTCPRRDPASTSDASWCGRCHDVVADAQATGEHFAEARHSVFVDCGADGAEGCTYGAVSAPMPCRPINLDAGAVPKAKGKQW
jgi:hypothetical protein